MSNLVVCGAVSPWISNWLTPLWLVGVGAIGGLLVLVLLWGLAALLSRLPGVGTLAEGPPGAPGASVGGRGRFTRPLLRLVSRRLVAETPMVVREGALWPLFWFTVGLAAFGIVGVLVVRDPLDLLRSLARLPSSGARISVYDVPVSKPEDPSDEFSDLSTYELAVDFPGAELQSLTFRSDQNVTVATRPFVDVKPGASLDVIAEEPYTWAKGVQVTNPFLEGDVTRLYVRNTGSQAAQLEITAVLAPPHPEVATIPITAAGVAVVFLLYFFQSLAAPRLSAIALATYKSEIAQPLFGIILTLGLFLLWLFIWIPYNTFGEDIKMLKDSGLTLIMVLGIIQAVWAASTSVAEEIEGRTALTVLSKPIGRRSFILGKLLGIVWTVMVLFVVLGLMLLVVVAYKPIYDAKETATQDVTWQLCHLEMVYTMPGLVLALLETVVLAALSVAISTRLPLLANFVISFAIYLLGHLTPLIVQSSMGQFVFVRFFGQLIATIFPNLDHFNIQAAVAAGLPVPHLYLAWAFIYCLIYSLIAMLLAWFLFEDRDLA